MPDATAAAPAADAPRTRDAMATKAVDKAEQLKEKTAAKKDQVTAKKDDQDKESKGPSGGFDSTPVPRAAPGYTVKFTFHRAINLPMADINTLSSDPYLVAELKHDVPTRHRQDPPLRWRTPTIRRNTAPEWNCEWIVCNVPARGGELKIRLYDEDPADHDDRLGKVHVPFGPLRDGWSGITEQRYDVEKRTGSKRAYLTQACSVFFTKAKTMSGQLVVSVQVLGRTEAGTSGKVFTLGPCAWSQHLSPMIGRLVGIKEPTAAKKGGSAQENYNFQANQIQLRGPVPDQLYHRYVEFRPFVAGMFNAKTLKGRLLNRALHHQHARIYNYDRSTVYGSFPEPCKAMTKQFLDLVHYDEGARIFTYVLMLDGQWRFTETGPEFSIDMLSKHTMHSDVSIYIAFSGEFFIRRRSHAAAKESAGGDSGHDDTITADTSTSDTATSKSRGSMSQYQLVIDNDSGTYRPNQDMLPQLKQFLEHNLPGLDVMTLSCVDDEEKMNQMKSEQRERKKTEGPQVAMAQADSDGSSISSSDEEHLDAAAGQPKQRGHAGKLWHKVSEPQEAVLGWAQKEGSRESLPRAAAGKTDGAAHGAADAHSAAGKHAQGLGHGAPTTAQEADAAAGVQSKTETLAAPASAA